MASTGPRHRCRGSRARDGRQLRGGPASTGPRHRCRGSWRARKRSSNTSCSFNGASASLPRIAANWSATIAALGVLQRGLGIAAEDRRTPPKREASLAVLQRGLGIAAEDRCPPSYRRSWRLSFNGASASLPRIGEAELLAALEAASFNGASASLPRIVSHDAPRRVRRRASTGPRHRCRGSL